MADEHPSPRPDTPAKPDAPVRARRWSPPPSPPTSTTGRQLRRLLGIPVIALAGLFIYTTLRERFVLPACDSDRAVKTLSQVLKELKFEPVRYAPIKTISSSKDQVVCNAVMPLPDGANVVVDYTFYWQGNKANMRYSIRRQAPKSSSLDRSRAPRSPAAL
jgi:hypothetical protein